MLVLLGLGHHSPHRSFGVANTVTLTRAVVDALMVGVVAETLMGGSLVSDTTLSWILVATAPTALLLGFVGLLWYPFLVFVALVVWIGAAQEASMAQMEAALSGIPVSRPPRDPRWRPATC